MQQAAGQELVGGCNNWQGGNSCRQRGQELVGGLHGGQQLSQQQLNLGQQHQRLRRTGQCSVCLRFLSLTAAGVIHQHGPSNGCLGSGRQPVNGSINIKNSENIVSSSGNPPVSSTSTDQKNLIELISSERCRVLKRIPKASRVLAAEKLSAVLARIVAKPDDSAAWADLLRFSFACFAVPRGRGGKRHQSSLKSKVNSALDAFPDSSQRIPSQTLANRIYNHTKKSDNLATRIYLRS